MVLISALTSVLTIHEGLETNKPAGPFPFFGSGYSGEGSGLRLPNAQRTAGTNSPAPPAMSKSQVNKINKLKFECFIKYKWL